jgi:hypothetical protein
VEALRLAAEAHDVDAVIACLAQDIVIRSPITQRIRFSGLEQAADLMRRVFDLVGEIRFYETVGEGERTQVIFWRGRIGGAYLEEANLLRIDADDRIGEMTVFMRPLPGLLALAATLGPSLARRRGRTRALLLKAMLAPLAAAYAAGEPLAVRLSRAGVEVPATER